MLLLANRDYLEDLNALSFSPWRKGSFLGFTCARERILSYKKGCPNEMGILEY